MAIAIYTFFASFALLMPFWALFLEDVYAYTDQNIIFFFSLYSITIALSELPAGLIADKIKAKNSMILATALKTFSMLILLLSKHHFMPYISQVVFALGESFSSGSRDVLAYRYAEAKQKDYVVFTAFLSKINILGIVIAFITGSISFRFGFMTMAMLNAVAYAISFISIIFIHYEEEATTSRHQVKNCIRELKGNRPLVRVLLLTALISALLNVVLSLIQPLLSEAGFSGTRNGYLYAFVTSFAILGSHMAPKLSKKLNNKFSMMMLLLSMIAIMSITFFEIRTIAGLILCFMLFRITLGVSLPFASSEINLAIKEENIRASIFSLRSLLLNIIQAIVLFSLSLIKTSTRYRYLTLLVLAVMTMILVLISKRKERIEILGKRR